MSFLKKLFGIAPKKKLDEGLARTKESFFKKIGRLLTGKNKLDDELLDELEESLITADVGIDTTTEILNRIQKRAANEKYDSDVALQQMVQEEIAGILDEAAENNLTSFEAPLPTKPYVIMVVGVNGVGKTTTIGKLAYNFTKAGKQVLLGAADTFRAAAVDQLTIWSERTGVQIVKQNMGSDPAAVAFDTISSGVSKGSDVIIIDTAGRLHNKAHLMDELSKIKRVMQKVVPDAPHEVLLVLDGSTGQNALNQAKQFSQTTQVTGLAVTKLDGTAKGGVVLAIAHEMKIPVKFIGVGEQMDDLLIFDKYEFAASLMSSGATTA
jgi:fused signal recognition particle receptor